MGFLIAKLVFFVVCLCVFHDCFFFFQVCSEVFLNTKISVFRRKIHLSTLTWHCKTNLASSEAFQGLFMLMERTGIVLFASSSLSALRNASLSSPLPLTSVLHPFRGQRAVNEAV